MTLMYCVIWLYFVIIFVKRCKITDRDSPWQRGVYYCSGFLGVSSEITLLWCEFFEGNGLVWLISLMLASLGMMHRMGKILKEEYCEEKIKGNAKRLQEKYFAWKGTYVIQGMCALGIIAFLFALM